MCGSNDLIKHNGLFQCSYCGMQYTLEEAKIAAIYTVDSVVKTIENK